MMNVYATAFFILIVITSVGVGAIPGVSFPSPTAPTPKPTTIPTHLKDNHNTTCSDMEKHYGSTVATVLCAVGVGALIGAVITSLVSYKYGRDILELIGLGDKPKAAAVELVHDDEVSVRRGR
ncbi:hypothetical protein ACFE04_010167 [Oxalis oulophora]